MIILTGGEIGRLLAQIMIESDWVMTRGLPASQPPISGKKPTGAAHAKRQAKKRKNIRARSKK